MKKPGLLLILMALLVPYTYAQQNKKGRALCQEEYIITAFIRPQLKAGPFKITKPADVDSLFAAMEAGWKKASVDSLKKYPSVLTPAEFGKLDAYAYFWSLASMAQNLDIATAYGNLLMTHMIPAMYRDMETINRQTTPFTIGLTSTGTLGNTLSIGTGLQADKETFERTFKLYTDYKTLFTTLAQKPDTTISNAAKKQLKALDTYYYPMYARHNYYMGDNDKAFNYLMTGLNVDRFTKSRAIDLTKKLMTNYLAAGDKDKCFALLNTLAINTTADNLNRDTLLALYQKTDPKMGAKMYDNLQKKLTTSAFKNSGQTLKMPADWSFISNAIPAEKLKKAKYIMLDFWYTGCGPCIEEVPELNAFNSKIQKRDDVVFISINTDYINGKETKYYVVKRSGELKVGFPIYYDEAALALHKQLGINGYPSKFILSSKGEVLAKTDQSAMSLASFETFLKEQK